MSESSAWIASSRAAPACISPATEATSAIAAAASLPFPLAAPICFERAFRRACNDSVRVCSDFRSPSSAEKRSMSRNGCGDLRVSSFETTAARSLRRRAMSSMGRPF
jgi:hypothetical protein